jgi:tetratricopeptide (TPR) repeat protein
MRVKSQGEGHLFTAQAFLRLAHLKYLESKTARAKRELKRAIDLYSKSIRTSQNERPSVGVGAILSLAGQHSRGEAIIAEALKLQLRELPKDGRAVAETKLALGECLMAQGRLAEAEILFKESLSALRARQLPQSPRIKKAEQLLDALYERRQSR